MFRRLLATASAFLLGVLITGAVVLYYKPDNILPQNAASATITLPDGAVYTGPVVNGYLSGEGKLIFIEGDSYTGEFQQGLFHGQGHLVFSDGGYYKGEFDSGDYQGEGELEYDDGDRYTGSFQNGKLHGEGRYFYKDYGTYSGQFEDDEFTGEGIFTGLAGEVYSGQFIGWELHGPGKEVDADGNSWEGTFSEGMLIGQGTYTGADGSLYKGEFSDGLYSGFGVLTEADGSRYEGNFDQGRKHGEGLYQAKQDDGSTVETKGKWHYGQLVRNDSDPDFRLPQARIEEAIYAQPDLLQQQFSSLQQGTPDKVELYFLGIASFGMQEVFRRETEYIRHKFDTELGTAGRSLVLINSRNTFEQYPMATVTSFEASLAQLEAVMDEEDILFIYFTSHGSKDHQLAVTQPGFSLQNLTSGKLKSLLDQSGIKWQAVAISACYSGGLLEPLAKDNRLVMTSASHDRTSFGCSDENEFTYFGRAMFKESLTAAGQFQQAFEKATGLLKKWEAEQEYDHSQPQIHLPEAMAAQLQQWRDQRRTEHRLATSEQTSTITSDDL